MATKNNFTLSYSKQNVLFPILLAGIVISASDCRGANPFITSIYTADPSAHVWPDGRLYVYPSRDMDPPRGCDLMDHYHAFSTADMVNWRDEGEVLNASQVSWGRSEGGFMWAPDCAYRNGTYYFYFPHPSETRWNDSWKIGVATSSQPATGFKSAGIIQGLGGFAMIDPAVFMDTDGQAYIYFGGGGHCQGAKLKENMIEPDGVVKDMDGLDDFHEATWVFKRKDIYYLTYADNHPGLNRMQYATSSSPLGPWKSKGVYLDTTDCDTSHGSVVEYKDEWYQFYHNKSLSGQGTLRSVCVDRLYFNEDGSIQKVIQTKSGVPSVGLPPASNPETIKYMAETAEVSGGASIENDTSATSGKSIQNLHLAGSSVQFAHVAGGKNGGRATIEIHYSALANAKLKLLVNNVDYSYLNTPATQDWSTYSGHSCLTVPLSPGTNNIIKLVGGAGGINVDYIAIDPFQ